MNRTEFDFLCGFLRQRSGLILSQDKMYLIESRLLPVAKKTGLKSLEELVAVIRKGQDKKLIQAVTEAMTTNESFFFRDKTPFDTLREQVLPALIEARGGVRQLRIWSAAASTGQEPYSIAMILKDMQAKIHGWRLDIIGTDLSHEVLEKARAGMYSQFEVQRGLPIQMLVKYFKQIGEMWQIDAGLRAMVNFQPGNLLERFDSLGKFDIIFCRNVLIYFDQETKKDILERMVRQMPEDGMLFLGSAETVLGVTDQLAAVKGLRGVYCKKTLLTAATASRPATTAPLTAKTA